MHLKVTILELVLQHFRLFWMMAKSLCIGYYKEKN